jgi:hypothetical protein
MPVFPRLRRAKIARTQSKFIFVVHIFSPYVLRYSEEELATFKAIMKLERGFDKVVDACAADADVFLALIKLVSDYMRGLQGVT